MFDAFFKECVIRKQKIRRGESYKNETFKISWYYVFVHEAVEKSASCCVCLFNKLYSMIDSNRTQVLYMKYIINRHVFDMNENVFHAHHRNARICNDRCFLQVFLNMLVLYRGWIGHCCAGVGPIVYKIRQLLQIIICQISNVNITV